SPQELRYHQRVRAAKKVDGPALLAGRYRLAERIGRGASSEVFRAVDERSGAERALKLYARGDDARAGHALVRELEHLLSLTHEHIIRAHDFGRVPDGAYAGRAFLVTDLAPGGPLESLANLTDDAERVARWIAVARDLADALAYL